MFRNGLNFDYFENSENVLRSLCTDYYKSVTKIKVGNVSENTLNLTYITKILLLQSFTEFTYIHNNGKLHQLVSCT